MFSKLIEENGKVSARELHEVLKVKSRFNDWIKNRINKYGFEEGYDYEWVTKILVTHREDGQRGTANATDCDLTINMAKELAMVENNEVGRQVRKYFIRCEEIAKELLEQQNKDYKEILLNETLTSRESREVSAKIKSKSDKSKKPGECAEDIKKQVFNVYNVKAYADIKRVDLIDVFRMIDEYEIQDKKRTLFDIFGIKL